MDAAVHAKSPARAVLPLRAFREVPMSGFRVRAHPVRTTLVVILVAAVAAGCGGKAKSDQSPVPERERRPDLAASPGSAVTTVNGDEMRNAPSQRIEDYLSSRVSGLHVYRDETGQYTIRIRGTAKFRATDEEPLLVIDNIPVQPGGTSQALAGLDTRDIAQVTVLKYASATAIYGSRGGNGVLVIKTRNGMRRQ